MKKSVIKEITPLVKKKRSFTVLKSLERFEQEAFIQEVTLKYPNEADDLWANENGGSRHFLEAINLKKRGVKAGIPDLFFAQPRGPYHGLFIEMKRKDKKKALVTFEQQRRLERLKDHGYRATLCYGSLEAIEEFEYYLSLPSIGK